MEREAFARAWRFLNYKPLAKWAALLSAVCTGILYAALLVVLGLFADLMVHRGRVPTYRGLPLPDQQALEQVWSQRFEANEPLESLQDIGIDEAAANSIGTSDPAKLSPAALELLWRARVYQTLRDRVGVVAASYVMPEYASLPAEAQQAFQNSWRKQTPQQRKAWLDVLSEEDSTDLARRDFSQLQPENLGLLWRAHLSAFLEENASTQAADAFWRDRQRIPVTAAPTDAELADRGVLSLIVRGNQRRLERIYNPIVGWTARLCPWMWRSGNAAYLRLLLAVTIVLILLRALATFAMHYSAALAAIEATTRLRRAVYHHTFRLGTLAFRALGPGEAVSIFTRQLVAVHDGLYTWLTLVAREPVKFALVLALALFLNLWLSLAFLIFALLVWLIGGQVAAYFRREERAAAQAAAEQLALLQESLMLMRLVKCYLMELFNQSRVERQLTRYGRAQLRNYLGDAISRPLLIFLGTVAAAFLLYVAGVQVLNDQLGVARAVTLATALVSLYWPIVHWLASRRIMRRSLKAAGILFKFLDRPGEVGQVVGAEFLPPLTKQLVFDNVSLNEPGSDRKLLDSVTLSIQAGQKIALVGPEDMEKHAFVYLIPRFLDPNSGEIRIDKHNVRWVTLDSLRSQIAIVLQHNLLFNDTVANNIGCGDPGYDSPKIIEAAKIAHAHQFIQKLPKGYETAIGEMGHYLNPGEQFRVALARAIMRDPALLIVEEPASILDDDTKSLLDDTFSRILPGRTVIFLPHRISTIRSCDRIILLHKGRVEAAGEHRELLAQSELYRHLQYLEFNVFADQL